MVTKNRDEVIEAFRQAVLSALDGAAFENFGHKDKGWKDQDLPNLFRVLDSHVETLAGRQNIVLVEMPDPSSEEYEGYLDGLEAMMEVDVILY